MTEHPPAKEDMNNGGVPAPYAMSPSTHKTQVEDPDKRTRSRSKTVPRTPIKLLGRAPAVNKSEGSALSRKLESKREQTLESMEVEDSEDEMVSELKGKDDPKEADVE